MRVRDQVVRLLQQITDVIGSADDIRGRQLTVEQREQLLSASVELKRAVDASIYPHALPAAVFDPSDARLFGRLAAIALVAQDRIALNEVSPVYGSGIYAIYYIGDNPEYAPITRTETPIYIGKTQPPAGAVRTVEQGVVLTTRLGDHRRSITNAKSLDLNDFECRYLVIASGWEAAAERELMRLFHPVWNEKYGPLHGIGKHGDSAETRANRRSPWDTLYPGRGFAAKTSADQKPAKVILTEVSAHFQAHPTIKTRQEVIDIYVMMLASPPD